MIWTQRIKVGHKGKAADEILQLGVEGAKVWLYFNNENGSWVWAVRAEKDVETWLEAFGEYDQAVRFCRLMNWGITGSSAQRGWVNDGKKGDVEGTDVPLCPYCGEENDPGKGHMFCRACGGEFESFEIPSGVVFYCTRDLK